MVSKVESFIGRLRWKLFAIQNPGMTSKNSYGFNTTNPAPQLKELKMFEEDLFAMVKNIQFRPVHNNFQSELKETIKDIQQHEEIIVKADKTRNLYKLTVAEYKKLLDQNITTDYKKATVTKLNNVNKEAAEIALDLDIDDRVDQYIQSDAFITVKDHKESFPGRIECRLINPAKSNIGRISKQIISEAVLSIKNKTRSNQWINTSQVIDWFKNLENKSSLAFLKFDIVAFYPSITQKLFNTAVSWSKQYHNFTEQQLDIIRNCKKSFLFLERSPWIKKCNENFDVTMGAYDGAEVAEFVGLYILSKLEKIIPQENIGLYRDDGLCVVQGSGPEIEKIRKKMFSIFKDCKLKVTIEGNVTVTEFLDVYFDLRKESFKPYRKNNEIPVYINAKSNHPRSIKKELPKMIGKRVSNLSCSREVFENESKPYMDALHQAGYTESLEFNPSHQNNDKKKTRSRKIIWFNPPFSETVKTKVAEKFLSLIDKHFEKTELRKYFNRSTIKVSYSCMTNIEAVLSGHNKKLLSKTFKSNQDKNVKDCNCRGGTKNCVLNGKCLSKGVVYKAEVLSTGMTASYIGIAANSLKERYANTSYPLIILNMNIILVYPSISGA